MGKINPKEFDDIQNSLIEDGTIQKREFGNCIQGDKIFVQETEYPMSRKKVESLKEIAWMQKYYQCNPVRFIKDFFNIELLDAQAWLVQQSWTCKNVLWVCSRGFGKSSIIDILIMAKDMLFNNYWTYIASGSGSQAETTFTTLERLANDNIDSFMGSTGSVFKTEVEIKNANGDGFSHSSDGFNYSTYNGSTTKTLNSNVDKKRGMFERMFDLNEQFKTDRTPMPRRSEMSGYVKTGKKSGKLKCQSEWKSVFKSADTCRA